MANPTDKKAPEAQEQKPAEAKSELAKAVAEALKEALPATAAAIVHMQHEINKPAPTNVDPNVTPWDRCQDCGQLKRACKLEHIKAVVYPTNPRWARHFQGVKVNEVVYRSDGPGRHVTIPKNSDVLTILNAWERNEEEQANGRVNMDQVGAFRGY